MNISIAIIIQQPPAVVWNYWTQSEAITQWNFASDAWCCPRATIDLKAGGTFSYRMEAKDGSMGFDFAGTFTKVVPHELIEYQLADNRKVQVLFEAYETGTKLTEIFEAEDELAGEQQRQGWLCILENFKKFVEQTATA